MRYRCSSLGIVWYAKYWSIPRRKDPEIRGKRGGENGKDEKGGRFMVCSRSPDGCLGDSQKREIENRSTRGGEKAERNCRKQAFAP